MKFKIGDRVRIKVGLHSGRQGTVWDIADSFMIDIGQRVKTNFVDVDGFGKRTAEGLEIGYRDQNIEPIIPAGESEFMENVKKWTIDNPLKEVEHETSPR